MKTLVKICGITNLEDALCAINAGADAIGFIFAESPRQVTVAQVADIIKHLPGGATSIGLFVDSSIETIVECVQQTGLQAVQLQGDESPDYVAELKNRLDIHDEFTGWPKLTKAFRLRCEGCLGRLKSYTAAHAFLIDAYVEGIPGGTGQKADWLLTIKAKQYGKPVILAGGLTPENVAEAIATVQPYGVDLCSGVEAALGKKDQSKVQQFISSAKD